jgi:hypothetical protein
MIQAITATIVELVALMFALAAGAFLEEAKTNSKVPGHRAGTCIVLSLMLAACALGVAAR